MSAAAQLLEERLPQHEPLKNAAVVVFPGSYGVLPNPAMPNTFLAQAYDLDDPVSSLNCYHEGCCPAAGATYNHTKCGGAKSGCQKICADWGTDPCTDNACAPVYMVCRSSLPTRRRLECTVQAYSFAKGPRHPSR